MINITNALNLKGEKVDLKIESSEDFSLDGSGLTLMPALIDAHVHFRTPGLEHKENWKTGAIAAIHGGVTTVFDMPNTIPPTITEERLREKKQLIDSQLKEVGIPLRYHLYLGGDKSHFDEIYKSKKEMIGLKVFMGSSTGDLCMDDASSLHAAFSLAAAHDIILSVHAEDEALIHSRRSLFPAVASSHSKIRNHEVAYRATKQAIDLARLYKTRLYLLHISTKEELQLIKQAKDEGLSVFAETTPHHLFLTVDAYEKWGAKVQINPPLRTKEDTEALWEAIKNKVIDSIGSDHAPHTLEEKSLAYPHSPSGVPGVETTLPLLLNAVGVGRLQLTDIVRLMKTRIEEIFRLTPHHDLVLVDMNKVKTVAQEDLHTKCKWSPYAGTTLKGWPVCTILKNKAYFYG